jgi:hypothetical protein
MFPRIRTIGRHYVGPLRIFNDWDYKMKLCLLTRLRFGPLHDSVHGEIMTV